MASATVEKTAEELRKEIAELQRAAVGGPHSILFFSPTLTPNICTSFTPNPILSLSLLPFSQITERLRNPRSLRRSGPSAGPTGPRKLGGVVRPVR